MPHASRIGLLVLAALLACDSQEDTILVVKVRLAESLSGREAGSLSATVKAESGQESSAEFRNKDGRPVSFPTSFSLQISRSVMGPVRLEVVAFDRAGVVLARSVDDRLELRVGQRKDVDVTLGCDPGGCGSDGGFSDGPIVPGVDGGVPADVAPGRCGNGMIDDLELCDPAIPPGRRGACPPADCDDGLSCTRDVPIGSGCRLECRYEEVTRAQAGDGCCPAQATAASDADCSTTCGGGSLEPGETCDPGLPADHANACPTLESCDDQDSCTLDNLVSGGTCAAVCVHRPILAHAPGDGCCPLGASKGSDPDCPVVCGNGLFEETDGETCDPALAVAHPKRCSETCADEGNPCTTETLVGSGCQTVCLRTRIERSVGGDGCCLPGVGRAVDSDCPAVCGNGLIEPGEYCDKAIAIGNPGACPAACQPEAGTCLSYRLDGSPDSCTARCTPDVNMLCAPVKDGCCPQGCSAGTDPDCSATCGNAAVESAAGETCDTAIPAGMTGACPTTCSDANTCTTDRLLSPGTCSARCVFSLVSIFDSDSCCPPGGNALVDMDCAAACGNQIVEDPARETCDKGLPLDAPGACPAGCPANTPACVRGTPTGSLDSCTSRCVLETIRNCRPGDGCCPPGCTRAADDDCPSICGNGALETGESCDWGIPAGNAGSCSFLCDDENVCTSDTTLGRTSDCTRTCRHTAIRACLTGDRCCLPGCNPENDRDCKPRECGNRAIEAGETCDPPSSCPTACIDDGDTCTEARLLGDSRTCSATCVHMAITICSGTTADRCCPRGCLPGTDVDCGAPPPRPTPF